MQAFWAKIVAFFASISIWISSLFGLGGTQPKPVNPPTTEPPAVTAVDPYAITPEVLSRYPNYFNARTALGEIPGMPDGFVPQGVSYLPAEDVYLVSGYMDDKTASRLYVLKDGAFTLLTLRQQNGAISTVHAGGVTAAGAYIYISSSKRLFVLEKQAVLSAGNGDAVSFIGAVPVPCRASFCSSDANRVYVGEYHLEPNYQTDVTHALTAPDGTAYQALVFGYAISPDAPFGLVSDAPEVAFSTRDKVQGFSMTPDGTAILSCSGSPDSTLWCYSTAGAPDGAFPLNDAQIPLYYLTAARQTAQISIPRSSEDVETRGGDLMIVFESGVRQVSRDRPFIETNVVKLSLSKLLSS